MSRSKEDIFQRIFRAKLAQSYFEKRKHNKEMQFLNSKLFLFSGILAKTVIAISILIIVDFFTPGYIKNDKIIHVEEVKYSKGKYNKGVNYYSFIRFENIQWIQIDSDNIYIRPQPGDSAGVEFSAILNYPRAFLNHKHGLKQDLSDGLFSNYLWAWMFAACCAGILHLFFSKKGFVAFAALSLLLDGIFFFIVSLIYFW